ncbi:MAG: NFACT family protein [Candidatus Woesearchaeota archaeon]
MKHLTSYELMKLVEEIGFLINSRFEKAFQENDEIYLRFDTKPKTILKISIPNYICITKDSPKDFIGVSKTIRALFKNQRLISIKQLNFDRILELGFNTKKIIIELFDKGNIVICDNEDKILFLLRNENLNRKFKTGEKYAVPEKIDPFLISKNEFLEAFNNKNKELVKFLASDLGFGGVYAEELCLNSCIDKNKRFLSDEEVEILLSKIQELKKRDKKPMIVYENNIPIDAVPVELKFYEGKERVFFEDYSSALEEFYKITKKEVVDKEEEKILKAIEIQKQGINKIIEEQKEIDFVINFIYQNFQELNQLFEIVRKIIKEPITNKEKEEKIKSTNKFNICEINFKEKFLILEVKE